jgi:hypothetical protein
MKKQSFMERLRAKEVQRNAVVVGFAWYTEKQWARVKASAVDPERFEATYPEWVEMAEDALIKFQRRIASPVKVYIVASELEAWCLVHGKPNDASARAAFVTATLLEGDAGA